jgi:hypothetical protein
MAFVPTECSRRFFMANLSAVLLGGWRHGKAVSAGDENVVDDNGVLVVDDNGTQVVQSP